MAADSLRHATWVWLTENLEHNIALYFMHYNFCRIHQTLRVTPAMEAEIVDHAWTTAEFVALIDDSVHEPK